MTAKEFYDVKATEDTTAAEFFVTRAKVDMTIKESSAILAKEDTITKAFSGIPAKVDMTAEACSVPHMKADGHLFHRHIKFFNKAKETNYGAKICRLYLK